VDLGKAAEIQYGTIPGVRGALSKRGADLVEAQRDGGYLKEEVTDEDIALIVSKWTGVPVARMLEGELQKLLHVEEELARRVVGQTEALRVVADAVRRSRAGLGDRDRPVGSFLFLAPPGWARPRRRAPSPNSSSTTSAR
jgi:ATP-dependent Clp protease ATP-binding subunit ClpB